MNGIENMRNNAFYLTVATFVVGIFGFFLRWLQNLNGFDDGGLAIPGATITTVFVVYSVLAFVAFLLEERLYLRKLGRSVAPAEALHCPNFIVNVIVWVIAAVMVVACLVLMFSSDFARYPTMQRITSALGIFAGLCLPFVLSRKSEAEENGAGAIAAVIPVLFGSLWLITSYRVESENPEVWVYGLAILAIIAALIAFYYIAAYFFGRAKPARCILALQTAAYLSICTLMDDHSGAETLLFGVVAAAMLLLEFVVIANAAPADQVRETEEKE